MKPDSRGIKWVTPEQMHLTLKFLGEQPPALLQRLTPALTAVAAEIPRFDLALGSGGWFPPKGAPRVLWVGLKEGAEAICRLADRVEQACGALGLTREEKPFRPHLTIGRVKAEPASFDQVRLARGAGGRMTATGFALVESKLGPGGPTYQTIREFNLGSGRE